MVRGENRVSKFFLLLSVGIANPRHSKALSRCCSTCCMADMPLKTRLLIHSAVAREGNGRGTGRLWGNVRVPLLLLVSTAIIHNQRLMRIKHLLRSRIVPATRCI